MKRQTDYIQDALDSAYWAHIMGDDLYARQRLVQIIVFLDKQEKGCYEPTLAKKEKAKTFEDEYLIR